MLGQAWTAVHRDTINVTRLVEVEKVHFMIGLAWTAWRRDTITVICVLRRLATDIAFLIGLAL